jgi:uncharacterized membrane protein YdfJ with MMPL/SSD domain
MSTARSSLVKIELMCSLIAFSVTKRAVPIAAIAVLGSITVLPAILVLLGERAWWPSRPAVPQGVLVEEPEPAYAVG